MSGRQIFSGMQIFSGDKWLTNSAVIIEDNLIQAIISADMIKNHMPASHQKFAENCYLIPGMIDLHVHGANGKDVMDASPEAFNTIGDALAREGVTSYLATTMTADNQQIEKVLAAIAAYRQTNENTGMLGVHLEGPFISREKIGAQNQALVQDPDIELFKRWQNLADKAIKIVTLAPELPGAIEFIQALKVMNVISAVGHTNATYEQTCDAITAGCSQATHLFNAMSGIHQRKPGAVGALLLANNVNAELIADGFHLSPAVVKLAYLIKTKVRLLLVSDAMRAKCMDDGCYELGGQDVHVKEGRATLADGTIAGSTLYLPHAIKNMVNFTGCTLFEAIQMATFNPAQALGISDRKGTIEVGKDADFVVLDADFNVLQTVRAGSVIWKGI